MDFLIIKTHDGGKGLVSLSKIVAVEEDTSRNGVFFHLVDGSRISATGTIDQTVDNIYAFYR